jgi:hypothetical protein
LVFFIFEIKAGEKVQAADNETAGTQTSCIGVRLPVRDAAWLTWAAALREGTRPFHDRAEFRRFPSTSILDRFRERLLSRAACTALSAVRTVSAGRMETSTPNIKPNKTVLFVFI